MVLMERKRYEFIWTKIRYSSVYLNLAIPYRYKSLEIYLCVPRKILMKSFLYNSFDDYNYMIAFVKDNYGHNKLLDYSPSALELEEYMANMIINAKEGKDPLLGCSTWYEQTEKKLKNKCHFLSEGMKSSQGRLKRIFEVLLYDARKRLDLFPEIIEESIKISRKIF
jgi:hypothetical protein